MRNGLKVPKIKSSLSGESDRIINEFLQAHPVGVLAVVDKEFPHATVVYFSVDDEFVLTFTTKTETKKNQLLQENNNAMLVVFDAESQTTVQVIGKAEVVSNFAGAQEAFDGTTRAATKTSESQIPPISKLYAGKYIAYQLIPKQIHMAVFAAPDPGGYDLYQTIDFED